MKNIILRVSSVVTLLVTVAFVSAVASVSAQTPGHNITANIPFDFSVGDKTLSAGQYAIARASSDGTMLKVGNREESASRLTQSVQANEPKEQTMLVFNRYGSRYFLSQVWLAGEIVGRQMQKSDAEKAIEQELAKNNETAETVTLVAGRR